MAGKLGLSATVASVEPNDVLANVVDSLLELLEVSEFDYTLFFRGLTASVSCQQFATKLTDGSLKSLELNGTGAGPCHTGARWDTWVQAYGQLLADHGLAWSDPRRRATMDRCNPVVVPRGWVLERAARAAEAGDFTEVRRIHTALTEGAFGATPAATPVSTSIGTGTGPTAGVPVAATATATAVDAAAAAAAVGGSGDDSDGGPPPLEAGPKPLFPPLDGSRLPVGALRQIHLWLRAPVTCCR